MNYISILFFPILLLSVTSAYNFGGTKLYLDEIGVKPMAHKEMNKLREKVKNITFERMEVREKFLFLNFETIIDNPKSNVSFSDFRFKGELLKGRLAMVYESLFVLGVTFRMSVKVQDTLVFNSTGKITISGKTLILAIDYTEEKPIATAKFFTEVNSTKFDSAILGIFMTYFAKKPFTSNITAKLKEIEDDYRKNDPLSALETPRISEHESSVSINRSYLETEINEGNLVRMIRPYITYRDRVKRLYDKCNVTRKDSVTSICYCPFMLVWMFGIIEAEEPVNMEDWKLKGKVIELYEILPNLINYYQADADYKVIRRTHHIIVNETDATYKLVNNYIFKIEDDTVFSITTQFNTTIIAEVKNKKLFVKYNNTYVFQTYADRAIQPSGRPIIRRLMQAEVDNIKDKHMFTEGIPIEAKDQTNNSDFCFDLITNP